jgi:hypothetical protein
MAKASQLSIVLSVVTTLCGSTLLSLPYAYSTAGLLAGVFVAALCCVLALISCRWVIQDGEVVHSIRMKRKRRVRLHVPIVDELLDSEVPDSFGSAPVVRFDDYAEVAGFVCGRIPKIALLWTSAIIMVCVPISYAIYLSDFLADLAPGFAALSASAVPLVVTGALGLLATIKQLDLIIKLSSKGSIATALTVLYTVYLALSHRTEENGAPIPHDCPVTGQLVRPGIVSFTALNFLNFFLHNLISQLFLGHPARLSENPAAQKNFETPPTARGLDFSSANLGANVGSVRIAAPSPIIGRRRRSILTRSGTQPDNASGDCPQALLTTLNWGFLLTLTVNIGMGAVGYAGVRCATTVPEDISQAFPHGPAATIVRALLMAMLLCVFPVFLPVAFRSFTGILSVHGFAALASHPKLRTYFVTTVLAAGFLFSRFYPHVASVLGVAGTFGSIVYEFGCPALTHLTLKLFPHDVAFPVPPSDVLRRLFGRERLSEAATIAAVPSTPQQATPGRGNKTPLLNSRPRTYSASVEIPKPQTAAPVDLSAWAVFAVGFVGVLAPFLKMLRTLFSS